MSNANSLSKRSQAHHEDDGDRDEREPKRAKDEHVPSSLTQAPADASGQAPAAMEEPMVLAESVALPVPLVAVNVAVPTEPVAAPALNATNLYARAARH